jgi:glycosyltransferase involved in cell wall biosynthesis
VEVLHPPVDTQQFFPLSSQQRLSEEWGGYFLSYARLAHAKRIDAIIRAFLLLPNEQLRIIYGKNDPQLEEFRMLAGNAPNIEFLTLEDNSELPDMVRRARAVIYVSRNEDF